MLLSVIEIVEISLVFKNGLLYSGPLTGTHFVCTWTEFSAGNLQKRYRILAMLMFQECYQLQINCMNEGIVFTQQCANAIP